MCYRNILRPIGESDDQQTMEIKHQINRAVRKNYRHSNNEEYLDLVRLKLMVYLAGQCVCSELTI